MAANISTQRNDGSIATGSDVNPYRSHHDNGQWKQNLVSDMSAKPAEKQAQAAEREKLWKEKIVGRKFIEHWWQKCSSSTFKASDLPSSHRVIKSGYGERQDFVKDRLTIYLDDHDVVTDIKFG